MPAGTTASGIEFAAPGGRPLCLDPQVPETAEPPPSSCTCTAAGASREDPVFDSPRTLGMVAAFLRAHLGGAA